MRSSLDSPYLIRNLLYVPPLPLVFNATVLFAMETATTFVRPLLLRISESGPTIPVAPPTRLGHVRASGHSSFIHSFSASTSLPCIDCISLLTPSSLPLIIAVHKIKHTAQNSMASTKEFLSGAHAGAGAGEPVRRRRRPAL